MGTRADYYLGRGKDAKWLCSTAWDGYPVTEGKGAGIPAKLLDATTEDQFLAELARYCERRDDVTTPDQGWPWPWNDSLTTDYSYAFENGTVYITCFGHGWVTIAELRAYETAYKAWRERFEARNREHDPEDPEPEGVWEGPKTCEFPDMTDIQNVTLGKRSGVTILSVPKDRSIERKKSDLS